MAKKTARASHSDFNMAAETRAILTENGDTRGKEALAILQERFPKQKINPNSFGMAYSTARKALGLPPLRKTKRVRKDAAKNKKASAASGPAMSVDLESLKAAARLLKEAGSADKAIAAIKHVQSLQIPS